MWSLRGKRWSGYLSWRRRRRFVHRGDVLERLTKAVQAENPVQMLVTGDLAHVGLPAEIEAATGWLEALGPPERVMLVPGNHDAYARDSWPVLTRAWGPYLTGSGAESGFPSRRCLADSEVQVCLIGLSSAVPTPMFMASGRLGADQCQALDAALGSAEGFRCVLVHHPPLPGMTSRRKGLADAPELARVLARRGAELVLHGHVHRNVAAKAPGGARVFGTASASASTEGKEVAAYRCFDVSRTGCGWRVDMRLMSLVSDGNFEATARESWETAPSRGVRASAASAAR